MVMAVSLLWRQESLFLLAGYENGLAVVGRRHDGAWDTLYKHQAHSQPILSLDFAPSREYFFTSGADAIIAKHPIPDANPTAPPVPLFKRTESSKTGSTYGGLEEDRRQPTNANISILSAGLASASSSNAEIPQHSPPRRVEDAEASPLKIIDTRHSGQQGLHIRSDGRIFVTAGWDSKVRVYSTKTMAELAVLKWHDVGCYATAFSVIDEGKDDAARGKTNTSDDSNDARGKEAAAVTPIFKLGQLSVKDRRIKMAKDAHWLVAGSKDGKISLWDIY